MSDNEDKSVVFKLKYGSIVKALGFAQIPNVLIRYRKLIGITTAEAELASYLISYEYDGLKSFPSYKEYSRKTGVSTATAHRAKKGLIKKGFLRVVKFNNRNGTNLSDLTGLRRRLREIAKKVWFHKFLDEKVSPDKYQDLLKTDSGEDYLFNDLVYDDVV